MAVYTPTSTNYPSGVITLESTSATPYEEIQESMGSSSYQIKNIYLKTDSTTQILQPLILRKYDSNGDIDITSVVPTVDPYQKQTSLNIGVDSNNYILDGKLNISYEILSNENVSINLDTIKLDKSSILKMKDDEVFLDFHNIFSDYSEKVDIRKINIINKDDSKGVLESNDEEECCC
jgi:hypothetical protein